MITEQTVYITYLPIPLHDHAIHNLALNDSSLSLCVTVFIQVKMVNHSLNTHIYVQDMVNIICTIPNALCYCL